jgi:hypothetical protein
MFRNKSFVFIGRYKKNGRTKQEYENLVEKNGGKNVTSISNKTDYVIFPKIITKTERNNKQIKKLKKIHNQEIQLVYCSWLDDCIKKKSIIRVTSKYKVEEFYKKLPSVKDFVNINTLPSPFYENIISRDCKIWKEFVNESGNIYYYNILNGRTTFNPCNDFTERLIGGKSILDINYSTEKTGIDIINDINSNVSNFDDSITFLKKYKKNLKKRLRDDSEIFNRKKKRRKIGK